MVRRIFYRVGVRECVYVCVCFLGRCMCCLVALSGIMREEPLAEHSEISSQYGVLKRWASPLLLLLLLLLLLHPFILPSIS